MQTFDDRSTVKTTLVTPAQPRGRAPDDGDRVEQLVCGFVNEVDPADRVPATAIVDLKGIMTLPKDGVVFFEDNDMGQRLFKLALENSDLLGIRLTVLKGYPNANYSPAFDLMAWDLPVVAYDELAAEIVSSDRVSRMKREEAGERQKTAPRDNGLSRPRTKHFDGFEEVEVTGDGETDEE